MSRISRTIIAGGAALALLAGSGATFARWYDEKPLTDVSVTTGTLSMQDTGTPTWKILHSVEDLDQEPAEVLAQGEAFDPENDRIVPGDYVVLERKVKLNLVGKNLKAQFDVVAADKTVFEDLATQVVANCDSASGGNVNLTEADNGRECTVHVAFRYPFGPGNEHAGGIGTGGDGTHEGEGWHKPDLGMNKSVSVADVKLILEQMKV